MIKIAALAVMLLASTCYADQKALTDKGAEVMLYDDGTWKYLDAEAAADDAISVNKASFAKSPELTFLLKSSKNNAVLYLNPKKWTVKPGQKDVALEYRFARKDIDLYGGLVTERMQIPLESLIEVALHNARNAAPDAKIVHKEYRSVNGKKVLYLQLEGSTKGIHFSYLGYYYSDAGGTTQLVTYTTRDLLETHRREAEIFLNGLTFN